MKTGAFLSTGFFTMILALDMCDSIQIYGMINNNHCRWDAHLSPGLETKKWCFYCWYFVVKRTTAWSPTITTSRTTWRSAGCTGSTSTRNEGATASSPRRPFMLNGRSGTRSCSNTLRGVSDNMNSRIFGIFVFLIYFIRNSFYCCSS